MYLCLSNCRSANQLEDEVTMVSQKWCYDQYVKEDLSIVAVLDTEDSKPTIIGALIVGVVSKKDPPTPMVQFFTFSN